MRRSHNTSISTPRAGNRKIQPNKLFNMIVHIESNVRVTEKQGTNNSNQPKLNLSIKGKPYNAEERTFFYPWGPVRLEPLPAIVPQLKNGTRPDLIQEIPQQALCASNKNTMLLGLPLGRWARLAIQA